jgi:RNA polymerase sigma factor (sigma-70 family)
MSGELIPYDDIQDRQDRGAIGITAITRLKHAELFAAAKEFSAKVKRARKKPGNYGGQSALARKLKVHPAEFGKWVNLQSCPPAEPTRGWPARRLLRLEATLLKITGKSLEELFPQELRDNIQFLSSPKTFERTVRVEQKALAHYAEATRERMLLTQNPELAFSADEIKEKIAEMISTFSPKEQLVLSYRYGLNGEPPMTLDEVGKELGVLRERVRQIEAKAIRKMQAMFITGKYKHLREVVDAEFEDPQRSK